ncbi:bifunctional 2-C-methyl-D-erythritol 4-phosphate cytidylyltransferase/2-C-methyl-D-erythritol 2,4-cyclodiphosphate synthase [Hydrogenimonas sp.]
MSDLTLVLLAAGDATRFQRGVKKQWLRIGSDPLWLKVARRFDSMDLFEKIVVASHPDEIRYMRQFGCYAFTEGGDSRQASLLTALKEVHTPLVLVSDVARACVTKEICEKLLESITDAECAVPALKSSDTVYYDGKPADREKFLRIQTPQLSRTEALKAALERENRLFTDESSAIYSSGGRVVFVEGDASLHKLTFSDDVGHLPCLKNSAPDTTLSFTGSGYDVHAFEPGKKMMLCGIPIEADYGFKAHSDGDVAIHALIDALLGAAGMGDIGELFPDTDAAYAGADSGELLKKVVAKLGHFGFDIVHADLTIMAQQPKISPYKAPMRKRVASLLGIEPPMVNIKATTTEGLGFVGRKEGVAVSATATLKFHDWTKS